MRFYDIIKEGRDAPLYHGTSIKGINHILLTGKIEGKPTRIGLYNKNEYTEVIGVSATRDKFLRYSSQRFSGGYGGGGRLTAPVAIDIKQSMLVQNFKISPKHDAPGFAYHRSTGDSESEEVIIAPLGIPFTSKYVKNIIIFEKLFNIFSDGFTIESLIKNCEAKQIPVKIIGDSRSNSRELVKHR